MALDFATNPTFTGRITAPSANYPQGSSQNESVPGVSDDGMPHEIARSNDVFGLHQGLLRLASITPNAIPDTAVLSQYIQAIVELASGRATFYVGNTGTAADHLLTLQSNQHGVNGYFDGMVCEYFVAASNVGAVTVDVNGFGQVDLFRNGVAMVGGELRNGSFIKIRHLLASNRFELVATEGTRAGTRRVMLAVPEEIANAFTVNAWVTLNSATLSAARATSAIVRVYGSTFTASTLLIIANSTSAYIRTTGSGLAVGNSTIIDAESIDLRANVAAQIANTQVSGEATVLLDGSSDFDIRVNSSGGAATLRHVQLLGYYI